MKQPEHLGGRVLLTVLFMPAYCVPPHFGITYYVPFKKQERP